MGNKTLSMMRHESNSSLETQLKEITPDDIEFQLDPDYAKKLLGIFSQRMTDLLKENKLSN